MEAMQAQSVDVVKRMKEITLVMQTPEQVLEAQGVTSADIEGIIYHKSLVFLFLSLIKFSFLFQLYINFGLGSGVCQLVDMLDELQEHVESIDMANGKVLALFL